MKAKVLRNGHIIHGKMAEILIKNGKAEYIEDEVIEDESNVIEDMPKDEPIEKQKAVIEKQKVEVKKKGRPAKK